MQLVQPQPFDEAVAKLGARSVVGSTLNSAEWRDVPVALRETAFFSSQVQNVRFLERVKAELTDYLAGARDPATSALKTGSRAEFVSRLQRFALAEGMGPLRPQDKGGLKDITSEKRLALIFDVPTKAARDYGNWKQGMDPAVLDEFPAQRFIRVHRVKRPRPYHQAALGEVRLKTDTGYWVGLNRDFGVPWGPWGFGSGCDVEDVDRDEAESLGLVKAGQRLQPVDKRFTDSLAASLQGVDPALRAKLKAAFGDRILIEGDTVRWAAQSETPRPVAPQEPEPAPVPVPAAAAPASVDEALQRAGLVEGQPATAIQMAALQEILKKPDAVPLTDKLSAFKDARGMLTRPGLLAEQNVRAHAQDFLSLISRKVAETLPPFRIIVEKSAQRGGWYDRTTKTLALQGGLRTADPQ